MKELAHGPLPDSSSENFLKRSVRFVAKKAIQIAPPLVTIPVALAGCGEKNSSQQVSNSDLERTILAEQYELPFQGTWYLTGGPHNFRLPIGAPIDGLASDLDFAPKPLESCGPGQEIVLKDWNIAASKSGIVTVVGDEKNKKDPNHSIVQIKHADGKSTRYTHSADIQVKKGDAIKQGQVIAHPSCEVPPDGYTTGLHLDFSKIDANDKPEDIRGLTFSGWKVDPSSKNYQGTLSKPGEKTRTANGGRYADPNGEIRNDLTNSLNKAVVAVPKDPIRPISATITSKEVFPATAIPIITKSTETPKPTSVEKPVEKGWTRHNSPDLPYSVDYPDPWVLRDNIFAWELTGEIRGKRITDAFTTWAGTQFSVSREPLGSDVTLDNFKDSIVREIKEKFEKKWGILVQTSTGKKQVIAGENAYNVQFIIQGNPTPKSYVNWLDSVYIFTKDGYGWIVQLETMRPYMEDTMPVLEKMAQSLNTLSNLGEFKADQSIQAPKSTETKKPEVSVHREGILPMGSWQFEIQDWKESDYQPFRNYMGQQDKRRREGWKYVTLNGRIRNLGANIGSMDLDLIQFSFLSEDNNKYNVQNSRYRTSTLPPGFSDSFFLAGWIPEIQKDYSLSIVSINKDLSIPQNPKQGIIKKAEVTKDSPVISPEVVLNGIDKPWIIPNFGVVTYDNKTVSDQGHLMEDYVWDTKTYRLYQYISLSLQNNTGQDIFPDSSFVIFPKNGDRIYGERATRQGFKSLIIPPGSKKSFYVYMPIEDTKIIDEEIKGGILLGLHGNDWFVWQLP